MFCVILISTLAYTHYSFFEWSLIILDVVYDSIVRADFAAANLQVRHLVATPCRGDTNRSLADFYRSARRCKRRISAYVLSYTSCIDSPCIDMRPQTERLQRGPSPTLSRLSLLFRVLAKRLHLQQMALREMLLPIRPLSRYQKASVEVSHSFAIYTSVSASVYRSLGDEE